jgi:hypothetical protein
MRSVVGWVFIALMIMWMLLMLMSEPMFDGVWFL